MSGTPSRAGRRDRRGGEVEAGHLGAEVGDRERVGADVDPQLPGHRPLSRSTLWGMSEERNVLGGALEPCGTDPVTGFFRDGCCSTGPEDVGSHTVCAVVSAEFLAHQKQVGNDLSTPWPQHRFPGLVPGDRWCVVAARWLQAYEAGLAAPVVLAATHERALDIVPIAALRENAVDVPADPGALG